MTLNHEMTELCLKLAKELSLPLIQVSATVSLLEEGNTIPFIARYRKEVTGNLDEVQIRTIEERLIYLKELEERRSTILNSIESQNKLTDELKNKILLTETKSELEDLYLPYKPKRRTRAMIAREKGLEPLAHRLLEQPLSVDIQAEVSRYLNPEKEVNQIDQALALAQDIVAEMISENADVRKYIRDIFRQEGMIVSKVEEGKNLAPTKYEQYYDYKELLRNIPSHRYLAIRRGEKEDVLKLSIEIDQELVLPSIAKMYRVNELSPYSEPLKKAILDAYKRLIAPSIETDLRVDLKMDSDKKAVEVFADNLRNLLLAAPLGGHVVIGIDPGIRTGCKCAVVDETGKFLDTTTIYISQGDKSLIEAEKSLLSFIKRYKPFAIAVGNGTFGRETEKFLRQLLKQESLDEIFVISLSEAGASVYSASDVAREEFPDLDLTIRGAISIARRLQDPLAELVKVDPKAIGVGQYQHDVHQPLLHDKLKEVVESSVNHVGVELNTASASLLSYVAGINSHLAKKIIKHREKHGAFKSRFELMEVSGVGEKTFEQAAGFLRIRQALNPLDASQVHPESYKIVEKMARDLGVSLEALIANESLIHQIDIKKYLEEGIGELTLKDIIKELKKPGRDPRNSFEPPKFREDIMSVNDLKQGMKLEGIVTNVTAFGAFVDIGVHQDGLIHLSELSHKFIKDPNEAVKVGDKIQVEVISVDLERKRISLTAKIGQQGFKPSIEKRESHKPKPFKAKPTFSNNPFQGL